MRALIAFVAIGAVFAAVGPVLLLALGTYNAIGNIELLGFFETWSGGSFLASIACWVGYCFAYVFCRRAFISRSLAPLRSAVVMSGLVTGVVAGVVLEVMWSPNATIYIPWGFFLWPTASLVILGLLGPMWPNPALNTDAGHAPRPG